MANNHNDLASVGFTICTASAILCPQTLESSEEKNMEKKEKKKKKPV